MNISKKGSHLITFPEDTLIIPGLDILEAGLIKYLTLQKYYFNRNFSVRLLFW